MRHSFHAFTTIKHPHFKVTFFQLASQHPEPAEHGGVCEGVFWHSVANLKKKKKKITKLILAAGKNICYLLHNLFFCLWFCKKKKKNTSEVQSV